MATDAFMQELFAERIGGRTFGQSTVIYKFEKIKRAKRAAVAAHPELPLVDMGVGEPDEPAFPEVVAALAAEAGKPENRFYSDNGCREFKVAVANYMKGLYGAEVDPDTEVNHTIGSKSALTLLPSVFINPGDVALMTTPGYGVLEQKRHQNVFGNATIYGTAIPAKDQ